MASFPRWIGGVLLAVAGCQSGGGVATAVSTPHGARVPAMVCIVRNTTEAWTRGFLPTADDPVLWRSARGVYPENDPETPYVLVVHVPDRGKILGMVAAQVRFGGDFMTAKTVIVLGYGKTRTTLVFPLARGVSEGITFADQAQVSLSLQEGTVQAVLTDRLGDLIPFDGVCVPAQLQSAAPSAYRS